MKIAILASLLFLAGCTSAQTAETKETNTVPTTIVAVVEKEKVAEPVIVVEEPKEEKVKAEEPKKVDNEPKYRYSCIMVVEQGKPVQKCKKIRVRESFQGTPVPR